MFLEHAYNCTHCDSVFVDRFRANLHMNTCVNIIKWATKCREGFPIHHEFLSRYQYWTSDKVVLTNRVRNAKVDKSEKELAREKHCEELMDGKGVAQNAFNYIAPLTSSVGIEMNNSGIVPTLQDDIEMVEVAVEDISKNIAVYDVEQDVEYVTTSIATKVVTEVPALGEVVFKTEVIEDDFGNTHTGGDSEIFSVQGIVNSFSDEYLALITARSVNLDEFSLSTKNTIILALCAKLTGYRTTLELGANIRQLKLATNANSNPQAKDTLEDLDNLFAEKLSAFIVKQEVDNDIQKFLVTENSAAGENFGMKCSK